MKLLGMLLSVLFLHHPPATVIAIDIELKKPASRTEDFTFRDYLKKKFPVYATDLKAINHATEKVAKLLSRQTDFSFDTVLANHSFFILNTKEEYNYKVVTVRVVTLIEETNTSFDFELVGNESNRRKAQKKLLDFAGYIGE